MSKNAKRSNKLLVLLVAFVLVIGCTVGGTLAWLIDSTAEVKNTFSTSDVDIELAESLDLILKMIPGCTITKDPVVTVKGGSEKCWVFVKVEESSNFSDFMTYAIVGGWIQGSGTIPTNVYYRTVDASTADQPFPVLEDNAVLVKETVTKQQMSGLTEATNPTLTFTAYACQYEKGNSNFTAADAWEAINPST